MRLVAPTVLRIAPDELARRARERFGGELRRAGSFAQVSLLGAQACLDAASQSAGSLGVLWASGHGAIAAARVALAEAASGEPVMPFTFVATQPHLAATLLAQRGAPVARAALVHVEPADWPRLLVIAQAWLRECERVLLGWVEESLSREPHRSDWCLLDRERGALPAPNGTFSAWLASATS